VQDRLLALNPKWTEHAGRLAPDGDADLPQELEAGFRVVVCRYCSGILKPHVVFFGETVPRPTVEAAYAMVEQAEALLVVGSSLAVFSGYRFVRAAKARAIPVAIVNLGTTRADPLADIRIEDRIGAVLPRLARRLGAV
jgi:NAD-dependent SIR2 family protein deacetylase